MSYRMLSASKSGSLQASSVSFWLVSVYWSTWSCMPASESTPKCCPRHGGQYLYQYWTYCALTSPIVRSLIVRSPALTFHYCTSLIDFHQHCSETHLITVPHYVFRTLRDFLFFFMYILLLLGLGILAFFQISGGNPKFATIQVKSSHMSTHMSTQIYTQILQI